MPLIFLPMLLAVAVASQPMALTPHRTVQPNVDAFPRIVRAANEPQRRINLALDRLDKRVGRAARECLAEAGARYGGWQRRIDTPMRGPEFISYVVTDDTDCGGVNPNNNHSAIVYDMKTGAPVVWTELLPRAVTGQLTLHEGADGVRVVTLASVRLSELYRAGYHLDAADEQTCRDEIELLTESGPVEMLVWLDAEREGLALQFDLNHARQACSRPVIVPAAVLRREGASLRLLNALAAAHADLRFRSLPGTILRRQLATRCTKRSCPAPGS